MCIRDSNKIKKVAETTSNKNLNSVLVTLSNNVSPINAKSKTTAMFIKLFATNIVANNFLGRSNSLAIICIATDLFSKPSLILDLVKEKTATSAPEISAEQARSTKSKTTLNTNEVLKTKRYEIKTVGSGSNIK